MTKRRVGRILIPANKTIHYHQDAAEYEEYDAYDEEHLVHPIFYSPI
jgi:hypothetical protein